MNQRIAIVILNYLAYQETEKCIESIIRYNLGICGVVVVDNASYNESYDYLKQKYKSINNIKIIRTDKNYGFAKGNNVGIEYVRKTWNTDFVLLLNSDTQIIDSRYLVNLLKEYQEKVGLIFSPIKLQNNKMQYILPYYLSLSFLMFEYIYSLFHYFGLSFPFYYPYGIKPHRVIHGCAFLLTPDYFQRFDGLYPYTFLYREEIILSILLNKAGLKIGYSLDTKIFHNEFQSSNLCFDSKSKKRERLLLKSYKHVLLVKILPLHILKKVIRFKNK